jgi:hypothetical protein
VLLEGTLTLVISVYCTNTKEIPKINFKINKADMPGGRKKWNNKT